jgi:hypothetical protein
LAALVITRENVIQYLRFSTMSLRNADGKTFDIIESPDGFRLDGPQRPPEDMRCAGENAEGDVFTCRGYMARRGQMFSISMFRRSGHVE